MADATRRVSVRLSLDDAARVKQELREVGESGSRSLERIQDGTERATRALGLLDIAVRGVQIAGLAAGLRAVVVAGDALTQSMGRLNTALGSVERAGEIYDRLYRDSLQTGVAVRESVDAFARFSIAAREIGATSDQVATLVGGLQRIASLRPSHPAISIDKPPPTIDYVKVENDSRLSDAILLRRIEPFVGKPMAPDEVGTAMRDIYAMGMFSRVDYRIEQAADGRTGLVVSAVQRPGDANRLRPGVTIAASSESGTEFDFSAELRLVQLDSYGSEARFVGALGERMLFSAEYFKVLDSYQRWFVDVTGSVQKRPIKVYDDTGFRLGEYDASYGLASLALGRQFGTVGEVRVGIDLGSGSASLQEGDLTPRDYDLEWGQLAFVAGADTLDNPYFPGRGMSGRLQWNVGLEGLGSETDFQTLRLDGLYAFSRGRQAFNFNISGGDTIQGDLPLASLFTLGGPFSFPGYSVEELTGETFAVARGMYRYKLTDSSKSLLKVPIYVGATLVAGNAWARHGDAEASDLRVGANVFLAADTLIGPVFITAGAADDGRTALYFFVGKPF